MGTPRKASAGESVIEFLRHISTLFFINVILAASLNVINGYCGLFSLGHAGFFAVGAYSAAAFTMSVIPGLAEAHPLLALLLAGLVGMSAAAIAGLLIGIPCLRLTGDYLAIATLGFGEIIRVVLLNMDRVGGARGLPGIPQLTSLPIVVGVAAFTLWMLNNLNHSSYGRCILAVREDEIAARSMGVNVRFFKTLSFVTGSAFAGLAGALFAHYQQFMHPDNFNFVISVTVLLMIVVGGLGSQTGAVLGALVVTLIPEMLRFNSHLSLIRNFIFGAIMIVTMLVAPSGLMGVYQKLRKRVSA